MGVHKQERTVELAPGIFVGGSNPCFVLAEAGINHNGEIENAKLLIDLAKLCGVWHLFLVSTERASGLQPEH
jgi:hypothetical protein